MASATVKTFCREALAAGEVWHLLGRPGAPAAPLDDGRQALLFWSTRARAERVVARVPLFAGYQVGSVRLGLWRDRWLVNLAAEGMRVGLNWPATYAVGTHLEPEEVAAALLVTERLG
ncbi:MAG TPA: DUF2750 domain-containing protein [Frankiaceae bacterium]|nr:DUF2750 domain-containing protein [Frankiaceae bacterium]